MPFAIFHAVHHPSR